MPRILEPGLDREQNHKPEEIASNDLRPTSRGKRTLIVGATLLTLMVGSTPAANAATSKGDSGIQIERICWFSRC